MMESRHCIAGDAFPRESIGDAGQEPNRIQRRVNSEGDQATGKRVGHPGRCCLCLAHDGGQTLIFAEGTNRLESLREPKVVEGAVDEYAFDHARRHPSAQVVQIANPRHLDFPRVSGPILTEIMDIAGPPGRPEPSGVSGVLDPV